MIVVDTNVISEALRPEPDANVLEWLDRQTPGSLFLTATIVSEAFYGVEKLPDGKRKNVFREDLEGIVASHFTDSVLPFDEPAARSYAKLVATASRRGKTIQVSDGQIAAVALVKGFHVATRDVDPFEAAGVKVINPWLDR